jgi:hypothetical protein
MVYCNSCCRVLRWDYYYEKRKEANEVTQLQVVGSHAVTEKPIIYFHIA